MDIRYCSTNTVRWRNDVGRRLADLEIVLGTHRREVQVKTSLMTFSRLLEEGSSSNLEEVIIKEPKDYLISSSIQVEGLTLEQEAELMKRDRGKDFASMTERLGRLEELAR